uniref:Uncharacterized protein n=1 Tax=Clytia hemisphaerica TaxID=252671 RepID=A0A7M5UVJ0_9CNID
FDEEKTCVTGCDVHNVTEINSCDVHNVTEINSCDVHNVTEINSCDVHNVTEIKRVSRRSKKDEKRVSQRFRRLAPYAALYILRTQIGTSCAHALKIYLKWYLSILIILAFAEER